MKAGAPWQVTLGRDLEGQTLGILGLGKLGPRSATVGKAFGMKTIAWSQNLTPEKAQAGGAESSPRTICSATPTSSRSTSCCRRSRGMVGARELSLMKPTGLSHQHLARADRRRNAAARALRNKDRRRGLRRLRRRAAAARPSIPQARQCRDHAAPRLCDGQNYHHYFNGMVEDIRGFLDGKPVRVIDAK